MKSRLYIFVMCVFLSISSIAFSTHIVGGSLTYVYNGGSSYTVTLKLYRDCGPNTAGFPNSITVNVEGYNGAAFSPSLDIIMNLGTVSTVPPSLDPCAITPNPMPCVQEGIYTRIVNNLPPNPGGYHMTYQVIARNVGLTNVNATCNCIGESFYANIPGTSVIWAEDFTLANNTVVDNGSTAWSIAAGPLPAPAPATARVNNNLFEITGFNLAQETWTSQTIPISCPSVNLSVDLSESGTLDANDSIFVYYRLNGGPLTLFSTNGFIRDDFTNAVASATGLAASSIQIVIRVHYDGSSPTSEIYRFDNVVVSCNDFVPNSNPVFNLFPPIFVCVGQPFTFNHSATDANGDSLVYGFYTPYNGDNAIGGALDPTFPGNTASFTPIVWQPGYSATNPLGGVPLNLNSSTGLLSGTAATLGQFVVGVIVREYRNGVYIGQTLRDFQFNVVNCPQPPPPFAGTDIIVNQGCTSTMTATGYTPATVVWNSVYPGALGAYNSYLSCTAGCLSPIASGQTGAPPYVDYQICGQSAACNAANVCDTVRVIFNFTLGATIIPQNPTICMGQTSTMLTANGTGGTSPYFYLWNSVNPSQSILVGNGTYTVRVSDGSGCPPAYATVTVTSYSVAISANAGPDQTICNQIPITTLNASVAGASGGIWSGGAGTFGPNNTTLTGVTYSPTVAELTAGFVNLLLTTTGNGSCPAAYDTVKINYVGFAGIVSLISTPVSCFGGNNGSATVGITGGTPPYTYSWSTSPAQSAITALNLAIGTYSVTITNGIGCTSTNPVTITQPSPVQLASSITHIACSGQSSGSISITPSGGIAPYTYLWQPGNQTTSSISSQPVGTYTITVSDSNSCQLTMPYTINQSAPIVISLTPTDVSCFNGNDGIASSTVSGGNAPYTYNWSSGASSPNATGLQAGTFSLTITDNLGCLLSNSVTIAQPTALITSTTSTDETCNYLNNGSATAVASGGSPGYTYLWLPGALTTISINNLSSGTYTLTTTDLKGCTAIAFATITEPALLAINFISHINVSCFAGTDGTVTASPIGGTPNYTYLWNNGATTAQISNLSSQSYTATVTDSKGCVTTNTAIITQPTFLTTSTAITNETCSYSNNGTATSVSSGGTIGYTYLWQPGLQTSAAVSNLSAGTYTLTVTDTNGCTAIANPIITEPAPIVISFTGQTNVSCFAGNDGAVTASPSGGTAGYTYLWASGGTTTATKTNLTAGTYSVTITDAQGCSATNSVVITQPLLLSASTSTTNETCNYLNDGTATGIVSGGTTGYTYLWQPGGLTSISINNLSSGTYTLTVTDAKGCTATTNAIIAEPAPLTISFAPTHVSCFAGSNGTLTASPTGGTPNYSYLWASGGATTASVSNLTAGSYTVTVTDNLGCVETNSAVITQPTVVLASTSITNETCNYLNNGTATAISSGGTGTYTYLWQPGLQTTASISNLSSGTYTLTVTDSNGCTAITNAIITQPAPIVISFTAQTNVSCFAGSDGAVTASPSGGTSGYTYLWASGGTTTANKTNLTAGTYSVTITDSQGCTATNSVVITQPLLLSATTSTTNETCNYLNNGTATAIVSGGTTGYTYLWMPGAQTSISISSLSSGTYTLTVTDAKGCTATTNALIAEPAPLTINFSPSHVSCFAGSNGTLTAGPTGGTPNYSYLWTSGGATTASVSNLTAGTYTVTVTDNSGCVETNSAVITQPTIVIASTSSTNETCNYLNNGTATAISSGGTGSYTYLWQPGLQTTASISNLSSGTYTLTVADANGCMAITNSIITQPAPIVISFTAQTNVSCFAGNDGAVTASPSGGTSGYTYLWASGGTTTATKTNLTAGTYSVTITDSQGCTATNSVVITQPLLLSASTSKVNETCNYLNNGTATAAVSGGTSGYTYLWMPGAQTTSVATGLSAGTYTVTVTDAKGCISTANTIIAEPAALAINFTGQINVSCFAGNDGSVSATPSGGTPNYSYLWVPGGTTTSSKTNLAAGTYTNTVTDSRGCIVTNSVTITQALAPLTVSASSLVVSCFGGSNGSVSAIAADGTGPYTYAWMPGSLSGQNIPNLTAGTYTVTATDSKGCQSVNSVPVTQPAKIILTTISTNSDCGQANGQSSVSVSGGNSPYTYLWSPSGGTAAIADSLISGAYTVLVTDFTGCTSSQFGNVNENSAPVATIFSVINVSCFGGATGSAQVGTSGGIGPFTYSWMPSGGVDSIATGLTAGTYTVTVTDSTTGCKSLATTSPDITQPPPILITVTKSRVSCFSGNDGTASAIASGGTPGYTYQWLPGGTTGLSVSNLSATTYTVQVTDSNNCVQTIPFTIAQPPAPLSATLSFTPSNCFAGSDGSVSASAVGGTIPYNYNWMPGNLNGPTLSNLSSGTYALLVTDIKGCAYTDSISVTQPTPLLLSTDSINSNCSLANGQASVVASGGTGAFLYQWTPSGGTNATATTLFSGPYTITVTDANGCVSTKGVTVNDNASPVATVTATSNISCNTGSNGTATVSVAGGAGPFTYLWSPAGGTNATATGLLPGTYTVTVTDINLCQSIPAISPEITQPSPILITVTKTNVSCFGGTNGTASAIASGGTSGYTYQWLPSGTTGASITNLSATTYTIQVTDFNSCLETLPFTITQPSPALSASLSFSPVSCYGGMDGSVSAAAAGGTAPYNYSWMPGNSNGPVFSNVATGTYTVSITDFNGCTFSNSISVSQPTLVVLTTDSINSNCSLANGQASVVASGGTGAYLYQWVPSGGTNASATTLFSGPFTITVTDGNGCISTKGVTVNDNASPVATVTATTNVSCSNGSNGTATVSVSGGAGPFTYSWLPSGGTNATATGLLPGTYTVTVTDNNFCQAIPAISPEITQPYPILISVTKSNVSCFGGGNGTASAIASGGTSGYTYQWQPGGIAGTTIVNLVASTYTIEVTDSKSCIKTLPVVIDEPSQLTSVISSTSNVTCVGENNGNATVTASGGSLTYNYNWLPLGGNGPTGTGLISGTYTVTVTDFKSCNTSSSVTITEPSQALSAISTGSSTSCYGGSNGTANINTSGGTPSYSYQWTPAVSINDTAFGLAPGNYTILITDGNNCKINKSVSITQPPAINGTLAYINPSCGLSNGSVSSQLSGGAFPYTYLWAWGSSTSTGINNLPPGTYNVQITDSLNCIFPLSANLVNIPSPVVAISAINNVACYGGNNGSTTINITQGTAPYAINWSPSGGNSLTASSLSIGTYTVNVTDAIGCQTSDTVIITEPTPIDVSISSINNVLCNGGNTGSITVSPYGGTGPLYTYSWVPSGASTSTAANLSSGSYTVNVMDQNNCTKSISATISQPAVLSSSASVEKNPACFEGTGSATVVAAGGVIPYSYSWSAPAVAQTGSTAIDLIAGSYTVTVTDTNGCISTSSVVLTQPQKLITTAGANDTICLGQSGTVTAIASGGTGSYYFVWQPTGINNAGILGITPTSNTTYTVVAYDQVGCAGTPSTVSAIVYTLNGANVLAIATSPICPGQITAVYVETSGTTGPLTYQWNYNLGTGPGVYLATPTQPTTYIVTVSNVCGLSVSDSVDVLFNPQPTVVVSAGPTALCALGGVQFTDISITGNINDPITSWYWNFGDGTSSTEQNPFHYFDQSGTFFATLTVNTDGGCTSENGITPLTITSYPAPIAAFAVNSNDLLIPYDVLVCDNQSVGANSYEWSFGEGGTSTAVNPEYVYTLSGTFQVQLIATSQYGCLDTAYAEVVTNANVIFPNVFTPDPNGSSGGTYTLFDLSNDVFFPYTYGVIEYKLEMFNRWGEQIFESLDIKTGWDGYYRGEICQQDVYVWKAYLKLNNGKVYNLSGDLTLLRY